MKLRRVRDWRELGQGLCLEEFSHCRHLALLHLTLLLPLAVLLQLACTTPAISQVVGLDGSFVIEFVVGYFFKTRELELTCH